MDILDLQNWKVTKCVEGDSIYTVHANYDSAHLKCQICGASAESLSEYDRRTKKIRDFPIRSKPLIIILRVARYKCFICGKVFTQKVDQLACGMKITMRFADYLAKQCSEKTFMAVSRETGVNVSTVSQIFTRFIEENERKMIFRLPRVLGADGVYIGRRDRLILTDVENKRFVGLYEKMREYEINRSLRDLLGKENVEIVTIDMSLALRNAVREVFPQAKIVIDKYHVQRKGKDAVDIFLKSIEKPIGKKALKNYRKDRFLLYRRYFNLSEDQRNHLRIWDKDTPGILELYILKEEFMNIWQFSSRVKAEKAFEEWKDEIPQHLKFAFKEILTSFRNWGEQIFNYFDYPFTNAFTESTNSKIKMIQKQAHGCGFWTVRAKMLCREYFKSGGENTLPKTRTTNYRYVNPRKNQKNLRLKQSYEQNSEVFIWMYPMESWLVRFAPHIKLLTKT